MTPSPSSSTPDKGRVTPKVDAQELILSTNPAIVCETYLFEPSANEQRLGYLFAAAETEDRGGVGKELIDVVMGAIQHEYFRDATRNPVHSFELALHQANLILHDASERGVRDWMGYFHVSVGALVGRQLHVSVAGEAGVWLSRKTSMTTISEGLSHLPITNPLRTFSQVASGEVLTRDTILFTTGNFEKAFRPQDVSRFTIDHSAATITARLQQLYTDQNQTAPVAVVTVSILPDYVVQPREEALAQSYRPRRDTSLQPEQLKPRKPLVIRKAGWGTIFLALSQSLQFIWRSFRQYAWPHIKRGSTAVGGQVSRGGSALLNLSKEKGGQLVRKSAGVISERTPGISMPSMPRVSVGGFFSGVRRSPSFLKRMVTTLPMTSKIFGVVAVILLIVLVFSLNLLQRKRAADQEIQHAAELLHEAQTKQEAASSALIYNNRDQAKSLLEEAKTEAQELQKTGFYENEVKTLFGKIQTESDRLQKITRAQGDRVKTIGDFASVLSGATPTHLFLLGTNLFTFNPTTNAILSMEVGGQTKVVSEQTKEIGFFTGGAAHIADKTIVLSTNDGGLALFDSKDNSLIRQDIVLPGGDKGNVGPLSLFGNRLYMYDASTKNIISYNKTLRGYAASSGPWITDTAFPAATIKSLTVDGNIFTLHTDGVLRRLFKGAAADFTADAVEPGLSGATALVSGEDMKQLYVVDPSQHRVVIFTKKGGLVQQIFFDDTTSLQNIAVDPTETLLYALDGTKVVSVSLVADAAP